MDLTIDIEDYKLNVRAACLITHNSKILLHKNSNHDYYALLGGRVKIGESSEKTIKREVKEELGKEIEIKGYAATIENFFKESNTKYHEIMFIYLAEFREEDDKNIQNEICNIEGKQDLKYVWIDLDKLDRYVIKPQVVKEILQENNYPIHRINDDL